MATSKPKYLPGQAPTCHAKAAVTGSRFVKLDESVSEHADGHAQVIHAGDGEDAIGVSAVDTVINGKVMVFCEGVVEVTAGEAIGHGDRIMSGANGVAMICTEGKIALGRAWADAADTTQALVKLQVPGAYLQAVDAT